MSYSYMAALPWRVISMQGIIFVILIAPPHFEAWKFYYKKMRNFATNFLCHKTATIINIWCFNSIFGSWGWGTFDIWNGVFVIWNGIL